MSTTPAKSVPERRVHQGRHARLEPLGSQHVDDLHAALGGAGKEERYRYLSSHPPKDRADMGHWIETAASTDDPLYFAVIDTETGRAGGVQSFMRIVPDHGVIEIGGIHWGLPIARTRVTTEAVYLFARHAFDDLGYRRFEWKCNALNQASRNAAKRFGFTFEGVFRQHMIQKGQNRDTAWFAMLDGEWPAIRSGFERWLDPENFDAEGRQKTRLSVR